MTAKKDDAAKVRFELLPPEALEGAAKVLTFGAAKYGDQNWRLGMRRTRLVGALLRHVFAWIRGESLDPESGLPHLDHALCCLLFLSTYEKLSIGEDDRWSK